MGGVRAKPLIGLLLQWVDIRMLKDRCRVRVRESRLTNSKNWGQSLYFLATGLLIWELAWIDINEDWLMPANPNSTCFQIYWYLGSHSSLAIFFISQQCLNPHGVWTSPNPVVLSSSAILSLSSLILGPFYMLPSLFLVGNPFPLRDSSQILQFIWSFLLLT